VDKKRQFHATGGISKQSLHALDWLNFFLSDVRDGIGPYLGIYLLATHHWDAGSIGVAMSAMGFATVVAQTPAGALIDSTRWKRLITAVASLTIALCCILMTIFVKLPVIIFFQVLMGIAAAVLMPAIAAITLGLVGYRKYPERQGRNEMFNHTGNVAAAAVAGLLGHFIALEWLFYAVAIFAIGSIISVLRIRDKDIDNELARGAKRGEDDKTVHISGLMAVLGSKPLLVFALAIILFHFANAAMLPLVGQYLTVDANSGASLYMSACIIVAQLVMIPVAKFAGAYADIWGRRPVFLIAFAVLPIRGLPGRYAVSLGAIAAATSIGASLSNLIAGYVANATSYAGGFVFLAMVAVLALVVFYFGVGETRQVAAPQSRPS
jgi:sugar phosphate permease